MRVFCTGLLVAAVAATLPQIASAQRPGGGAPGQRPTNPIIAALDANGDGTIDADELKNAVAALTKLDKDKDGKLSGEEIRPAFSGFGGGTGGGAEQFITRMLESDKDKDGKLSKEETPERMRENFDRLDTNKDGFLDKAELTAMAGRFGGAGGRPGGGAPGARPGARPEGAAPARPEGEKKP